MRHTPVLLLASFCMGLGAGYGVRVTQTAMAAALDAEPAVPTVLEGRGCRLGNSVVPRPSGPPVATICERPGDVMQGFLMQGAERIAVCCPLPAK